MKIFLMALAFLLIFTAFLVYITDLYGFLNRQQALKDLAEDCAAAAALCQDMTKYGKGLFVIEKNSAEKIAKFIADDGNKNPLFKDGLISIELTLYDDEKGYNGCEKENLEENLPAAVVNLSYTGKDLFRLPFLSKTSIKRSAVYQWKRR